MIGERARAWLAAPLAWRGALVVLAGGAVIAAWDGPWPSPAPGPPGSTPPAETPAPPRARPDGAADDAEIARHPLFFPTRQPWVPPPHDPPPVPAAAQPDHPPPTGYTLIGVVVGDTVRRAVLKPPDGQKAVVIGEGEDVDGWTLRRIRSDGLSFEANGASYEMAFPGPRPADK